MKVSGKGAGVKGLYTCSIVFILGLFLLASCDEKPGIKGDLVALAEFEEQESTFICWNPKFRDIILNLTSIIAEQDHVTLFYNERNHHPEYINSLLKELKVKDNNISLVAFNLKNDNIWIRDYGPIFMMDENGRSDVLTFKYHHEANQEYNLFNEQYSTKMKLSFIRSNMFSAGGGREINGKGTIILVEGYEKIINPDLSLAEIENEYKSKLNQKEVIWLKRGIPQDDAFDNGPVHDNIYGNGVNWHIDEFCRFADANTILLAKVDSADLMRDSFYHLVNERLEESYDILKHSKDQDGNPFKIIRVPQAPIIFNNAQYYGKEILYTPITSYLNYVLTNHSVVVPTYYVAGEPDFIRQKDAMAKKIFQDVFKNRKIVMYNSTELNYSGGGLHCITLAKPKSRKKALFRSIFERRKLG